MKIIISIRTAKKKRYECFYDLNYDKEENHNLAYPEFYDVDRYLWYSTAQCFYYPDWKTAQIKLAELRKIKDSIWKQGTFIEELYNRVLHRIKCYYTRLFMSNLMNSIINNGK